MLLAWSFLRTACARTQFALAKIYFQLKEICRFTDTVLVHILKMHLSFFFGRVLAKGCLEHQQTLYNTVTVYPAEKMHLGVPVARACFQLKEKWWFTYTRSSLENWQITAVKRYSEFLDSAAFAPALAHFFLFPSRFVALRGAPFSYRHLAASCRIPEAFAFQRVDALRKASAFAWLELITNVRASLPICYASAWRRCSSTASRDKN